MGKLIQISGPVVTADEMRGAEMYEMARVGNEELVGEIIELEEDKATVQVYEETSGLRPGEKVEHTGNPLSVELGPGLIGTVFDGIQRPLPKLAEKGGDFIERGVHTYSLPRDKEWLFTPSDLGVGSEVKQGDVLGKVDETSLVEHKIMVPPGIEGEIDEIVSEGEYKITDKIATISTVDGKEEVSMLQEWPVREPRPIVDKLAPEIPLISGQRVVDTFFPVAKGGTASIPGGFGTGKTVMLHQLAKWSDTQIVVYVGCGERGNEMTDVLLHFPELEDPRTGEPLMSRTSLIANTSNMPVAAREASIYTGITIAEYFRDMGYDVALMADSTSRWAEALREISGRLEEMPSEEGYPAYLGSRLAEFYERAGRVITVGNQDNKGSVTVMGAVSPPGGDFSEPVTQNTLRIIKTFWGLDSDLADKRHFPAINWLTSYSGYLDSIEQWWTEEVGEEWRELRDKAIAILQEEDELREIVQLVGPDALPDRDRAVLEAAEVIREDFLQQNAMHDVDTYCTPDKQLRMFEISLKFYEEVLNAVEKGAPVEEAARIPVRERIARMKTLPEEKFYEAADRIEELIDTQLEEVLEER
ncbi:ATP synthase subunit A [candidate division MSBL1 archaeon SCGC-AAA259I07]|uniref:A-type ATP synthase subunit A n=3 Tax=candidate division MSBL1 TaxID=215777 RepID=A0A133U6R4_9EURY|nr:ATP synthase subunit A [candidate division MSBL1 archaeon SCGC-AAA259B11]KXA95374.1 ATP synthase subunit A [candidate division MSBL1 archaeon SCGC-AAA259I07]